MPKPIEYKEIAVGGNPNPAQIHQILDKIGSDGWILAIIKDIVAEVPGQGEQPVMLFIFYREKSEIILPSRN